MPEDKSPPETALNTRATHSALRHALHEIRALFSRRSFWTVLVGGIVVVTLSGPFYTLERFALFDRLVFWGLTGLFATLLMASLTTISNALNQRWGLPWFVPALITASLGILPVMSLVYLANLITSGAPPSGGFWSLFPFVSVPLVAIHLTTNGFFAATRRTQQRARDASARLETVQDHAVEAAHSPHPPLQLATAPHSPERGDSRETPVPLLFEKLPQSLGRDLISLRAQDHYVEVTTALGTTTVLLRLSDAERDLIPFKGMRVHRSWWVNLDHVRDLTRTEGGGMEVTTIDGQVIPVARGQRTAVRQALDERRSAAE